jgi:hypothetical protein
MSQLLQLSAFLGLAPRQHSSGGKTVLLGISKHGDRYLRTLLLHGARSLRYSYRRIAHPRAAWTARICAACGPNVAAVALANHNARVLWALLKRGENYRAEAQARRFPSWQRALPMPDSQAAYMTATASPQFCSPCTRAGSIYDKECGEGGPLNRIAHLAERRDDTKLLRGSSNGAVDRAWHQGERRGSAEDA